MAEIIGGGPPTNESERRVIKLLRDEAPSGWFVLHNVEIPSRGTSYEVDLVVVTDHSVVLIDVKGTRGRIHVSGTRWHPEGRPSFHSPFTSSATTRARSRGYSSNSSSATGSL
ncbi:hypothetical protein GCM10029992_07750 [Glycomyces albus]